MCPFINTNGAEYHRCIVNSCDKKSLNESLLPLKKKSYIDITCLTVNMSNTELKKNLFSIYKDVNQVVQKVISLFLPYFRHIFMKKKNTQI